jgi:cell division septation protein DedD
MNMEERRAPRTSNSGWLATAGGALLLIALGFGVGIVAGTAYQEPELVADHLAGRTTEVVLDEEALPGAPDVAAAAPVSDPDEGASAALGEGVLDDAPEAELAPSVSLPSQVRAAAAPRVAPVAATVPAAAGGFSIQVGAFTSEGAARQLAGELGKHGYRTYLIDEGDGARWKVRVGPLRTKGEAEAVSARLKTEQRLPTWIRADGQG